MSAVPSPYTPSFSFYNWSQTNPNVPAPGQKFDIEFTNIKTLFDAMQARAALIQRDDGFLKNGSVGREQLAASFASGVLAPVPWTPFTAYTDASAVTVDGSWYWSLASHISGATFDAGLWQFVGTFFSADPLTLSLDTGSLLDGILSADVAGRAKMADGYVTIEKLDVGASKSFAKAWANFSPQEFGQSFNFSFSTNHITAVATGSLATYAGELQNGSIRFTGLTGNNAALNGVWKILTFDDVNTITFDISGTPAGALTSATGWIVRIYDSLNIKTIAKVSDGNFAVVFNTALSNGNYALAGTTSTFYPEGVPRTVLGIKYDSLPTANGFTLLCSSWVANASNFVWNNPDRVMFQIFGS